MPIKVADLNSMVQIRKRAPARTFKEKQYARAEKERQAYADKLSAHNKASAKPPKILDGFLLLHSCAVKLPHEAIRSKIAGENVIDVREEDLVYFKNLTFIDLSDN